MVMGTTSDHGGDDCEIRLLISSRCCRGYGDPSTKSGWFEDFDADGDGEDAMHTVGQIVMTPMPPLILKGLRLP